MNKLAENTFKYFAFGSNMLERRIKLNNPTAKFLAAAKLDNHKLQFDFESKDWFGAPATITPTPGSHVWGVIYSLDMKDLESLNRQEGVDSGVYEPITLTVTTKDGQTINCRSYSLLKRGYPDKRPSPQYLDVIIQGAKEHCLPEEYVKQLEMIEHNGYTGEITVFHR